MNGSCADNLAAASVANYWIPFPPLDEQKRIADYLDAKCAAIDADVAKRRELVGKLREYRKCVIARAVTRGLDGSTPMMDSGVEWIGEIPEGWDYKRLKSFFVLSKAKNHPDAIVLSLYREHGIVPKDSRDDNHNVTSLDTSDYKYVQPGDFVVNKMKAWQGSMALSSHEGIVSPAYHVFKFASDALTPKYAHYLLRSRKYADEWHRLSTGIRVGQWDLHPEDFLNTRIPLPPLDEQGRIADYLDAKCAAIDADVAKQEELISKLGEYRKSVIHAAVIGRIDLSQGA